MTNVRVFGLSRLESLDLKKQYPEAAIAFDTTPAPESQHGELVTAALIGLTLVGLRALSAWLLANQKKQRIEKTIEIVLPDGTKRTEKFVMELSERTSQADVIVALAKLTKFELPQVG